MTDNICTPVGRFVSGSLVEKRTRGHDGKPLPEEKQRFEFGVAFRKDDPALPAVFQAMQAAARTNPQHAALPAVQQFQLHGYSWKISDGDKPNAQGAVNADTAGHFVIWFGSSFPINTCDQNNVPIDPSQIERGYYVDLVCSFANNNATGNQSGIYANPHWVRLVAFGEKIAGGIDAATAFGGQSAPVGNLPPGASTMPVASNPPSTAMTPGNAAPAPAAAPTGQASAAPSQGGTTASPSSAPPPAHDFVQNATGQPEATPPAPGLPGLPG